MNFIRKFIGTSTTDEVASIPSGRLYLTRSPQSPKGEIECLYNDAFASIRQTTRPYLYQLCITRVYQEGEVDAHGLSGFDDSDDDDDDDHDAPHSIADTSGSAHSKDEWAFTILEDLKFHTYDKTDGTKAIVWTDLNGDIGDKFEFIIDEDIKHKDIDSFMFALYKCLYESKYHKSSLAIQDMQQLKEFVYNPKSEILAFGDLKSPNLLQYDSEDDSEDDDEEDEEEEDDDEEDDDDDDDEDEFMDANLEHTLPSSFPRSTSPAVEPRGETIYQNDSFDLFLFDSVSGTFKPQISKPDVELKLISLGNWEYTLYVHSKTDASTTHFNASINKSMNPTFNYEHLSFIFNFYSVLDNSEISAFSWLLKFESYQELTVFQKVFLSSMYETLNKSKWSKTDPTDQEYVTDAFSKMKVDDEFDDEEEEDEEEPEPVKKNIKAGKKKATLFVDDDDEFGDDEEEKGHSEFKSHKEKNSNLSVGYANNRTYVARGDKLGVFNSYNDGLSFQTTIADLKDLKGKKFNPEKMMLHQQDQFMVLANNQYDKSLFKMDLNRGKIVEEWEIDENNPIVSFGPNSKFAQLTNEQTLTGISENGLFKVDPRLAGLKLVNDNTYKAYKTTNNKFSTFATTEQGYLAVGSGKGDIRLYDRLGVNAKSALPSLGESILGIDVSKDGRWLLATCEFYLLLVDTKISSGQKNEGSLGFTKYFDKDKKPIPRRLTIKTEHAAFITAEANGKPPSFTQARFNTGLNSKETSIVTSSGPYIISWSLRKVLAGSEEPYTIKKYQQTIIADNFKFGSSSDVIIALQDDVAMTNKQKLSQAGKILKRKSPKNSIVKTYD
ncbi:VID27 cytoplasmic protein-domain-containing protein [Scheffersomyces coipomensis]|uniref:VID27 cytoplasmic protein-domain-containing protein n=1 Tax=Scheffersomyces coipomensis TaxID=1788519 RepID=UPI00315C598A